jgi:hypothetical protein
LAKGGGVNLDRSAAEEIAKKLGAEIARGAKHIRATVRYQGRQIASFGIRHSKDAGHDYIPGQIFVTAGQARRLADCTMSYDDYVVAVRERGKLPAQEVQPRAAAVGRKRGSR